MAQKSPTDFLNDPKVIAAATDAGTGGLIGFAAGFAMKKIGKVVLVVAGTGVLATQVLANQGMIDVNWSAVDSEAKKRLDLNKDGVLDVKDAMIATQSVSDYLSRRMPFGGGFGVGFLAGLKSG